MSRTTTREIIKVCADLAKLDRRAKEEVLAYLQEELRLNVAAEKRPIIIPTIEAEGGGQ